MTASRQPPDPFDDVEKQHLTAVDSTDGDGRDAPLTVRLGDLWSDLIRVADEPRDPEAPAKSSSAVPLLDDMKGILQWD